MNKLEYVVSCFESSLRELQREQAREPGDMGDDFKAFASKAVAREVHAKGWHFKTMCEMERGLEWLWRRLHEYAIARITWHLYLLRKEFPDADHDDNEIRTAAFAGYLISDRKRQWKNPHVDEWLNRAKDASPAAYAAFSKWCDDPKPAKWKYPHLDSWLILVWPLVLEEGWDYKTILILASEKFFETHDDIPPMKNADTFGSHCKLVLGLKLKPNTRKGRPSDAEYPNELNPLFKAAVAINSDLPSDSAFLPDK